MQKIMTMTEIEKIKTNSIDDTIKLEVKNKIICIRQQEVISDADVAELYGVETKRVNEAVKNNPDKFPEDYMFTLTSEEVKDLRSKFSSTKISTKSRVKPKDELTNPLRRGLTLRTLDTLCLD